MKKNQRWLVSALSAPMLLFFSLATNAAKAQEPTSKFMADLFNGIQVDSPKVFLAWGTGTQDSVRAHIGQNRLGVYDDKTQTQLRWDSLRIFDTPMDSIFMFYLWPPGRWHGLRQVSMCFNSVYVDQLKILFYRNLGQPAVARSKRGHFYYFWHYKSELSVYLSNRRSFGGKNGSNFLIISNPPVRFVGF